MSTTFSAIVNDSVIEDDVILYILDPLNPYTFPSAYVNPDNEELPILSSYPPFVLLYVPPDVDTISV